MDNYKTWFFVLVAFVCGIIFAVCLMSDSVKIEENKYLELREEIEYVYTMGGREYINFTHDMGHGYEMTITYTKEQANE